MRTLRRGWLIFLNLTGFSLFLMGLWFVARGAGSATPAVQWWNIVHKPPPPSIEFKDFVSILLTGLGLMIAIGAFFVAIVAVWGYKEAKDLVIRIAEDGAKAEVPGHVERLLSPELVVAALKSDPSLLLRAVGEMNETLFGDVDPGEAEDVVSALDAGIDEPT